MIRKLGAPAARVLACGLIAAAAGSSCVFKLNRNVSPGEVIGVLVYRNAMGALVPAPQGRVVLENSPVALTADGQGNFAIEQLPSGTYTLDATYFPGGTITGEVGLRLGVTVPSGDGVDLGQIVLEALGGIQGTVTSTVVPGGTGTAAITGLAETGVINNAFTFGTLLPGAYQVTVIESATSGGTFISSPATVQVSPGATAQVSISLTVDEGATEGAVQGTVLLSGATLNEGADIEVPGSGEPATSGATGAWTSGGIPPGIYTVTASLGGFTSVSVPYVVIGSSTAAVVPTITLFPVNSSEVDAGGPVDGGGSPPAPSDAGTCTCTSHSLTPCTNCPASTICNSGELDDAGESEGRCVTPSYFPDSDAGIVTDLVTGFVWQQVVPADPCPTDGNGCTVPDAESYCAALKLNGLSKWRLPALPELFSLVEAGSDPAIDQTAFPNTPVATAYATHTPEGATAEYDVLFGSGLASYASTAGGSTFNVRCVH